MQSRRKIWSSFLKIRCSPEKKAYCDDIFIQLHSLYLEKENAIGKHGLWLNFVLIIISGQSALQIKFLHFNKHFRSHKMQKTHSWSMLLLGKIIMQYLRACTSPLYSNMVIID